MKLKKRNTVECCLGVHCIEETARRVDELVSKLPKTKEYEYRRKGIVREDVQLEQGRRCDVSVICSADLDRQKEIVLPEGIDLTEFNLNPVVLWEHNPENIAGKCKWINQDAAGRGLIAKTWYPPRPADYVGEWLPEKIWQLTLAGVLRGKSIGFLATEIRDPTAEELAKYPDVERVVARGTLLEFSAVSIPANPKALLETIEKGIGLDLWGFKTVGRVKSKPTSSPVTRPPARLKTTSVAEELAKLPALDAERIAELAVKRLRERWQV